MTRILRVYDQISDALIFLHNLDYLHCAITSHAVQLVNKNVAKLCQLEFLVNCAETGGEGLARHSQAVLGCAGWQSLYNWLSPEVLRGEAVSKISDIYSLCVLVYELSTGHFFLYFLHIVSKYFLQGPYHGHR